MIFTDYARALRRLTLLLVIALPGCATTRTPPDDSDLRLQAASHAFGGRFEYLIIQPSSALADGAVVGVTGVLGPGRVARDLAERLAPAVRRPVRLMVTGARRDKTIQALRQAFALNRGRRLSHLELLFLGDPGDEPTVRNLVAGAGGQLRFAPFEL